MNMAQLFHPEFVQQHRPARSPLVPLDPAQIQRAVEAIQASIRAARRNAAKARAKDAAARYAASRAAAKAARAGAVAVAKVRLKERGYGAVTTEILQLLRDAPEGLTSGALKKALGGVLVASHLISMRGERGQVERAGAPGAYVYTITPKGRAHLAKASSRGEK